MKSASNPARIVTAVALVLAFAGAQSGAAAMVETEMFAKDVATGKLPPVDKRVPSTPLVVKLDEPDMQVGKQGGTLNMLIGRSRDVRLMAVYGYARLVGYDRNLNLAPDLLQSYEVKDDKVFTFKLRKGHRWSDGQPFTADDFRYFWDEVANNAELSPSGPPIDLLVDGEAPKFEVLDPLTVRYSWSKPNRDFLARLAGASALYIYRPAHYLKKFHKKFSPKVVEAESAPGKRGWAAAHNKQDNMYQFDNPELPTLEPWINTTKSPSDRFIGVRNPYFHRIDTNGRQLPYIDKIVMAVAEGKLIPAKAGSGESDLQARDIAFNNYTFLKKNEKLNNFRALLWRTGGGSQFSLYPNLNVNDPVWRALVRDVRFRRALSMAIDRGLVNQVLYFGLGMESNNTVLPQSPLFKEVYQKRWAKLDKKAAENLLEEIGLKRGPDGIRKLSDGRLLEIVVETAGESSEQTDVLELIRESWKDVGVKLFTKPSQREVLRNRVFSGEALMSVWTGLENGLPNADTSPDDLAPTSQQHLQWPKFGQHHETSGKSGVAPDIPEVVELAKLHAAWRAAANKVEREKIWHQMLTIHAEQQFTIGVISGVPQPVIARNNLMNVPEKGFYNFDPGAFFGIYRPDQFWFK
jgi:peptide/nickel transport system substrate-binding protein